MRCATVAQMKSNGKHGAHSDVPNEGTHTREVYDLLQSNKGLPVEYMQKASNPRVLTSLRDFYGLDVRIIKQGNKRVGRKSTYVLAGEWFGRVYVDYIAAHIEGRAQ
jgi:hypothetical protein